MNYIDVNKISACYVKYFSHKLSLPEFDTCKKYAASGSKKVPLLEHIFTPSKKNI